MSATEEAPALAEGVDTPTPAGKSSSLLLRSLKLWRTRIGVILVLILVVIAIVGPWVAPHAADEFIALPNSKPGQNGAGIFGTDYLGQDILSRFLYGGRSILWLSIVSTAIGLFFGVGIGLIAAYARNYVDDILMRTMDVIMAFPQIMLALVAVSLLGASDWLVIAAIALTTAPRVARVARGAAQPVVERDFIAATESMGLKRWRILNGEAAPQHPRPDDGRDNAAADVLSHHHCLPRLPRPRPRPERRQLGHRHPEEPGSPRHQALGLRCCRSSRSRC